VTTRDAGILGSVPVQPEEVFSLLRDKVEDRAKKISGVSLGEPVHAGTPWTEAVFLTLKEGLIAKYGGRGACKHLGVTEFMLDFVWWEQDDRRAIMGVECEWTTQWPQSSAPGEAAYDFKRLLCFKAPLKLFVFDSTPKTGAAVRERLSDCLRQFKQHVKGECYLLVEVQKLQERSADRFYKWDGGIYYVEHDGSLVSEVRFSPIASDALRAAGL
jgi:hypothetical protein